MRKRNYTVTIRMNKAEYDLLQSKVKESGQTQQAVVLHAIADLKIEEIIKTILPYFLAMLIGLLLVTYIPAISLFLPKLFGLI